MFVVWHVVLQQPPALDISLWISPSLDSGELPVTEAVEEESAPNEERGENYEIEKLQKHNYNCDMQ